MPIIRNNNARLIKFEAILDLGDLSGNVNGTIAYGTFDPEYFIDLSSHIVQKLLQSQDERLFSVLEDVKEEMEKVLKEQIATDDAEVALSQERENIPSVIRKDRPGYIYLVKADKYFKIGLSKNPKVRFSQIGLQLPYPYEVLHIIPATNMYEAEMKLHEKYAHQRLNGEWFSLTENEVTEIRSLAKI